MGFVSSDAMLIADDPEKYLSAGYEAVKEQAAHLIRVCGSGGKADA